MMDRNEIRACLTGPIPSVRTPFNRDGTVDFKGLRNNIDFVIAHGAKTILLTTGDSHYGCLSDEEITQVTRVACEQTADRAMVVAADRNHSTDRAVALAKHCKELGAAVFMCLPPDWGHSCTPETLAEHYSTVAKVMPVTIVTDRFRERGMPFGLRTIELALDRSPNIVAIKDDFCGEFAQRLGLMAHGRCALFSGGMKQNHLDMWPYGCDGYLATFINFKPEVTHRYWAAIEAGDVPAATAVIRDIDIPFFDFLFSMPGGKDAGIHGVYELFGIYGRWRRPPYYSLSDADMERLAGFLSERGLLQGR